MRSAWAVPRLHSKGPGLCIAEETVPPAAPPPACPAECPAPGPGPYPAGPEPARSLFPAEFRGPDRTQK
eukprot:761416-Hanusia_phi.AAC.6